jgi:multidrug efflux system outer membrane protein
MIFSAVSLQRASLSLALICSGCMVVGPDYAEPEISLPDVWHERVAQQVSDGSQARLQTWWTVLEDPKLDELIERARSANLGLQTAASRVRQARDQLAIASGARMPAIDGAGQISKTRQSDDGELEQLAPADGFDSQNLYEFGIDASWEIDLFGRLQRSIESATAQYGASIEAERDVMVTLFAEVALAYTTIREFQNRLGYARNNVSLQQDSLALAEERFRTGLSSKLDVVQARSNLETTRAVIPSLETARTQTLNRLAVLLGSQPGSLQSEFSTSKPIPRIQEPLQVSVPTDVVRQRPDIRRAERMLAARTAEIGVATAYLYPDLSLSGFFGLQSRSLNDLLNTDSKMWGIATPVRWSIYNGGQVRGNIRVQQELADQALIEYRQAVLDALAEVEGSLIAYNNEGQRLASLRSAVDATREAVQLTLVQYNTGLTDFNNVMGMQRYLFQLEDQLAVSQARVTMELVGLYKALGGGW